MMPNNDVDDVVSVSTGPGVPVICVFLAVNNAVKPIPSPVLVGRNSNKRIDINLLGKL